MNERDMFDLILDQPEPDLPSVVDAAVAGGRRALRRRRFAALASAAGVVVIAGIGVLPTLDRAAEEPMGPGTPPAVRLVPTPELPSATASLPTRHIAEPRQEATAAAAGPRPSGGAATASPPAAPSGPHDAPSPCTRPAAPAVCESSTRG